MTIAHKIVAYDRLTELVASEHDVPAQKFDIVRQVAGVAPSDPEAIGNYRLSPPAAEEIGRIIGAPADTKRFDFYLEPAAD